MSIKKTFKFLEFDAGENPQNLRFWGIENLRFSNASILRPRTLSKALLLMPRKFRRNFRRLSKFREF